MNFSLEEKLSVILIKESTEFLYKRLSWIYNEMERNTRRISQGSIRIRK